MNDDEDTGPRQRKPGESTPNALRRVKTAEDRDLEHRRWMQRQRTNPHGVPGITVDPPDEVTSPLSVIDHDLDPGDFVHLERLRRETDDPMVIAFKVAKELKRLKKQSDDSGNKSSELVIKAIGSQDERIKDLERKVKFATRIASAAIAAALAGIGGLMGKIWDKAGDERETQVRLRYLEDDVNRLRRHDERDERDERGPRRFESALPWSVPQPQMQPSPPLPKDNKQ